MLINTIAIDVDFEYFYWKETICKTSRRLGFLLVEDVPQQEWLASYIYYVVSYLPWINISCCFFHYYYPGIRRKARYSGTTLAVASSINSNLLWQVIHIATYSGSTLAVASSITSHLIWQVIHIATYSGSTLAVASSITSHLIWQVIHIATYSGSI